MLTENGHIRRTYYEQPPDPSPLACCGIIESHKVSSHQIYQTLKCPPLQSRRDYHKCPQFSSVLMAWLQLIHWMTSTLLNNSTVITLETKTSSVLLLLRPQNFSSLLSTMLLYLGTHCLLNYSL